MVKKNYINPNVINRITIFIQGKIEQLIRTDSNIKNIFSGEKLLTNSFKLSRLK